MRDKTLETKLRLISLQLDNWKKLHDVITYGLDKARPMISADRERQFTEIRANLLQETEHVLRELGILSELSGRAMNVLQRCVSVRGVRELSNEEVRRLESEWSLYEARGGSRAAEVPTQGAGGTDGFCLLRKPVFTYVADRFKTSKGVY